MDDDSETDSIEFCEIEGDEENNFDDTTIEDIDYGEKDDESLFEHSDSSDSSDDALNMRQSTDELEEKTSAKTSTIGLMSAAASSVYNYATNHFTKSTTTALQKQPPKQLNIFAITWNTESVLIAETLQKNGQEPVSLYSGKWLGCRQADFLPELVQKHIFSSEDNTDIESQTLGRHHLLVVALQESAKPGDYLLSHTFASQLGERYVLVHRGRMMGVGRTTMNAFRKEGAIRVRGLRLAVYARKDFLPFVHFQTEKSVLCTLQDCFTRGKGGYGMVLRIDGFGLMAFFNVHLPFVASTLTKGNHSRLATGVRQQNEAFCNILEQFLHRRALHHLFVLGDLNYRVMNPANIVDAAGLCAAMAQTDFREKIYNECDELKQSLASRHLPLPFVEGVNNAGPQFMPTAKMQHQRESGSTVPGSFKFGTHNHRNPSWCDRILYLPGSLQKTPTISQLLTEALETNTSAGVDQDRNDIVSSNEPAICTYYDRFESGETMTFSDHSAVCAYYTINRTL